MDIIVVIATGKPCKQFVFGTCTAVFGQDCAGVRGTSTDPVYEPAGRVAGVRHLRLPVAARAPAEEEWHPEVEHVQVHAVVRAT